ncbi:SDR family oxidoreductase [Candidatus Methylopumilus universalis]|uniref:dTDP-4-dehydrorhamnose reductase n=1 Tax=Candidatus Methylopumilus universalis TaxID=2588536 RepID=A0AAX1EZJ5_9PROT|nr:SDR family oxidoreductase [Candidatus Methylopumilus universalis]QDC41238.1 SDR family oxidoreductase [Candidatus Methylopumilus universalis]QDC42528.1 SDR family oxidoreductase [Candidatus Methylopumilus universalis]QDC54914.1 SDR family oxidoreductase [Candidatus Methylopumilus universalis]QDC56195.1 SDR family oxidoreductase [Candidatus Methylopumilus universalis]QDC57477.1 SDR family oxidoreductase [Candidatus Methylopumilus universalis]
MKILIVGSGGMLGSALLRTLCESNELEVFGTIRQSSSDLRRSPNKFIIPNINLLNYESLGVVIDNLKPNVVINCAGIIKQNIELNTNLDILKINAALPHRIAWHCDKIDARFIQISTDCIFSGKKGFYSESDLADADDFYGLSKFAGEISNSQNTLTIRTSIIGHGILKNKSLVDWFLNQSKIVEGYKEAIFSGMPVIALAAVIRDYIIKDPKLNGILNIAADPISKFDLLELIKNTYSKNIEIVENYSYKIDRSLNPALFKKLTGYSLPNWKELILTMYLDWKNTNYA